MASFKGLWIVLTVSALSVAARAQEQRVDFSQLRSLPVGSVIEIEGTTGSLFSKQACVATLKVAKDSQGQRVIKIYGGNASGSRAFEMTDRPEGLRITPAGVSFDQTRLIKREDIDQIPPGLRDPQWEINVVTIRGSIGLQSAFFEGIASGRAQNLACDLQRFSLKRGGGQSLSPAKPERPAQNETPPPSERPTPVEKPAKVDEAPRPAPVSDNPSSAEDMMRSFARWESEMLMWERRLSSASPGSDDESEATRERDSAGYKALVALSDVQTLARQPAQNAERFVLSLDRKVAAATPDSYLASIYKQARDYALWAYTDAASKEIASAKWDEAVNIALALNRKYSGLDSESVLAQTYFPLLGFAADTAQHNYEVLLASGKVPTRDAEATAIKYDRAVSGTDSRIDRMYTALRDSALRSALFTLNSSLDSQTLSSLKALESRYAAASTSAQTGSALAVYYGKACDLVRAELARR